MERTADADTTAKTAEMEEEAEAALLLQGQRVTAGDDGQDARRIQQEAPSSAGGMGSDGDGDGDGHEEETTARQEEEARRSEAAHGEETTTAPRSLAISGVATTTVACPEEEEAEEMENEKEETNGQSVTEPLAHSASVDSTASTITPNNSSSEDGRIRRTSAQFAQDHNLRIFFPVEDLAMKAILSPSQLRAFTAKGGRTSASSASSSTSSSDPPYELLSSASTSALGPSPTEAPSLRGGNSTSFAGSLLEHTTRLLFNRGNNNNNNNNNANDNGATSKATTPAQRSSATKPVTGDSSAAGSSSINSSTPSRPATTSVAIEDDVDKLHRNGVVMNPNLPPPPFANMFSCDNCHDDIGTLLSQGRHHCRNCGGSFCAACSSRTAIVPFQLFLSKGEQRVCDGCFNRIREFHAQAQTTNVTWCGLPPPSADALMEVFELPSSEQIVAIFNCTYFVDFVPSYGHLILTRHHVCFKGYRAQKLKVAYANLHSLVKPDFHYINALQINTKDKEKHFIAEFNGLRDLCFLRLDQLIRAFREGKKQHNTPLSAEDLVHQAMVRRKSSRILAKRITDSFLGGDGSGDATYGSSGSSSPSGSTRSITGDGEEGDCTRHGGVTKETCDDEPFVPLPPDQLVAKMTVLLDCELRADVRVVHDLLWEDGIGQDFLRAAMEKAQDIDIDINDWQPITSENRESLSKGFVISKEDDYSHFRYVRSQHPPQTKFPGLPPYATCSRLQRLRVETINTNGNSTANTDASNGTGRWSRFIISDLHRMSKIPFSDYFEIETRWVFTRDGKNYCHVQAGLVVNFLKSTWFKSQINSSTMSESKEVLADWAKLAVMHLNKHEGHSPRRRRMSRPSSASKEDTPSRRRSSSKVLSAPIDAPSSSGGNGNLDATSTAVAGESFGARVMDMMSTTPLAQWFILILLLYCVVLIRDQQARVRQLTETTTRLLEIVQHQQNGGRDAASLPMGACQQTLVKGVLKSIQDYFHAAHGV